MRLNLCKDLDNKLSQLNLGAGGAEEDWIAFTELVYNTAFTHLGQNTRKHQDWFDENEDIRKLLDELHKTHGKYQQDKNFASEEAAYKSIKSKMQAKLREMQGSWLSKKADEIQQYADSNNTKCFYDALKTIYGPQSSGTSQLLNADGTRLLTDENEILERWAEHFNSVLKRPSSINAEAIVRMPQVEINTSLAEPLTEPEVQKAIKLLSSGKAPGSHSIPAATGGYEDTRQEDEP